MISFEIILYFVHKSFKPLKKKMGLPYSFTIVGVQCNRKVVYKMFNIFFHFVQ